INRHQHAVFTGPPQWAGHGIILLLDYDFQQNCTLGRPAPGSGLPGKRWIVVAGFGCRHEEEKHRFRKPALLATRPDSANSAVLNPAGDRNSVWHNHPQSIDSPPTAESVHAARASSRLQARRPPRKATTCPERALAYGQRPPTWSLAQCPSVCSKPTL